MASEELKTSIVSSNTLLHDDDYDWEEDEIEDGRRGLGK